MNSTFLAMLLWTPLYSLPAAFGCYLVRRFGNPREPVLLTDWLCLVLPWLVWFASVLGVGGQKSLSNLGEAYALALICIVIYWIRLRLARERSRIRMASVFALVATCISAVLLATFVPALSE